MDKNVASLKQDSEGAGNPTRVAGLRNGKGARAHVDRITKDPRSFGHKSVLPMTNFQPREVLTPTHFAKIKW